MCEFQSCALGWPTFPSKSSSQQQARDCWEFTQETNVGDDAEVMSCSAMDLHIGTAAIGTAKVVLL